MIQNTFMDGISILEKYFFSLNWPTNKTKSHMKFQKRCAWNLTIFPKVKNSHDIQEEERE